MAEPLARGVVVPVGDRHAPLLAQLAKESASILRALRGEPEVIVGHVPPEADYVVLVVDPGPAGQEIALPDLKDRAGCAIAVAEDAPEGRAAVAAARKRLRTAGAALGARELVFRPDQFGVLGLESDGLRERLEVLLQALVLDAERLRLRREGWEEPEEGA